MPHQQHVNFEHDMAFGVQDIVPPPPRASLRQIRRAGTFLSGYFSHIWRRRTRMTGRAPITEQRLCGGSGTKIGEGVCIDQARRFVSAWYLPIMPNFSAAARGLGSSAYVSLRVMESSLFSPHLITNIH